MRADLPVGVPEGPYTVTRSKYPQDGEYDFAVSANINGKPYCIAETFGRVAPDIRPNAEALANIFAAAPELLAALKPFAFCDERQPPYGVEVDDWEPAVLAARAAIAKATGAK